MVKMNSRALSEALAAVESAVTAQDAYAIWRGTRSCLDWLYSSEELAKVSIGKAEYFKRRAQDADGPMLAALTWLRGLVVHQQWAVGDAVMKPIGTFAVMGGKLVPMVVKAPSGGQLVPVSVQTARLIWRERQEFPALSDPDKYGRDLIYDQRIAGRPLVDPLSEAVQAMLRLFPKGVDGK